MKTQDWALISVDASALGAHAAFGAVVQFPDGTRLEISGPLPRSEYQEVTSALAALRYLPAGMSATLHLDAQADALLASLCVTHPHVHVLRIPRNSTPDHERAHDLARAALKRTAPERQAPVSGDPQLAVYAIQGVDTLPRPRFAVTWWRADTLEVRAGEVPRQLTKALTLDALRQAAQASAPPGLVLSIAGKATPKLMTREWNVTREQLAAMRREAEGTLS